MIFSLIKKLHVNNPLTKKSDSKKSITGDFYEIYSDWDKFPDPLVDGKSFFSGREELVEKLSNWITDSNGGSILVSGVRGVGKTAFVYHSIKVAKEKIRKRNHFFSKLLFKNKKIQFIPINATCCVNNCSKNSDNDEERKLSLLKQIIKNYYEYTKDRQAKKLYLQILGHEKLENTEASFFNFSLNLPLLISLVVFIIAVITKLVFVIFNWFGKSINEPIFFEPSLSNFVMAVSSGSALSSWFYFKSGTSKVKSVELNYSNLSYVLYEFDLILRQSKNINIFVIDEIDKLTDVHEVDVDEFISDLKNLLTISNGRFIFINNDSYSLDFIKNQDKDPYPPSSTFFNWQIFIPGIWPKEIELYLSNVLKSTQFDRNFIRELSYYISYKSNGIFSKVLETIRDFIEYRNEIPYLSINNLKFDENKKRIARLTKLYYRVISDYDGILLSEQIGNHNRKEITFNIFKKIINLELPTNIEIKKILDDVSSLRQKNYDALNSSQKTVIYYEILDVFKEINARANTSPLTNVIPEDPLTNFNFSLTQTQVIPKSDDLSTKRKETTEVEKSLINEINKTNKLIEEYREKLSLPNREKIFSFIDEGSEAMFEAAKNLAKNINPDKYSSQEEVKNRQEEVSKICNFLTTQNVNIAISAFIDLLKEELHEITEDDFKKEFKSFPGEIEKILIEKKYYKFKNKHVVFAKFNKIALVNTRMASATLDSKKVESKLLIVIFGEEKKSQLPAFKELGYLRYQEISNLPKQFASLRNFLFEFLEISAFYSLDWTPVASDSNGPWKYDSNRIPFNKKNTLSVLNFEIVPYVRYWRAGIAINANEPKLELSPEKLTFFHLYQDTSFEGLKYRRFIKGTPNYTDKNIDFKLKNKIIVKLIRSKNNAKHLKVFVNDELIDTIITSKADLNKTLLLAWADGQELNLNLKNIRVLNMNH
jgi:hypothetical protein